MYFDLAKRLDDSNDQVRIAACTMLKSFAGTASPGDMRGGPVEYIVDCLLVHLDDTDRAIQASEAPSPTASSGSVCVLGGEECLRIWAGVGKSVCVGVWVCVCV